MGKMRCWIGNMSIAEGYSIEYMSDLGIDSVTDDILRREREFKKNMIDTKEKTTTTPGRHHISTRTNATRLDAVCPPANLY